GPTRIVRVSAMGGELTPVTSLDPLRNEIAHAAPRFFPDGRNFLYHALSPTLEVSILLGSLDSKPSSSPLFSIGSVNASSPATYAPPGYLLFVRGRTLTAQPFDQKRFAFAGEAIPIAEQVGSYAVSQNEVLVYRKADGASPQESLQLAWFDRSGK